MTPICIENVIKDDIGFIYLMESMGGDTTVVNSARISFGKRIDQLEEKDERLVKRLIDDKHVSVLRSTVFTFYVKCPLFIRNQWYRHVIGGAYSNDQNAWNEISRRYTDQGIEFYVPKEFRLQSSSNKQGSISGGYSETESPEVYEWMKEAVEDHNRRSIDLYHQMLDVNVAREQARMVLPQNLYTEFYWTASLQAVLHFLDLRNKPDAQWEIQQYAVAIEELVKPICPVSMTHYKNASAADRKLGV